MSLGDFFSRLGTNIGNAPAESWFALAQNLAGTPTVGQGLAQGLAGFGQANQAVQKKAGLAAALESAMGGFSPQQQSFLKALGPDAVDTVAPLVMQNLFKKGASWKALDTDKDGRPDVQVNEDTGQVDAYPLSYSDRAFNMQMQAGVSPVAPGLGVDPRGNVVPSPGQGGTPPPIAPPREPRPANVPAPAGPDSTTALDPSMAPPVPTVPVSVPPNGQGRPQDAPIMLQGDALKRMNLGNAPDGQQWALDRKTLKPVLVPIQGYQPTKAPIETQIKNQGFYIRQRAAEQTLQDPGALEKYLDPSNAIPRSMGMGFLQSGPAQAVEQAGDEWINAVLRPDSGAAIPDAEMAKYRNTYVPVWGDKSEKLAQKQASRIRAAEGIKAGLTPEQVIKAEEVIKRNPNPSLGGKPKTNYSDVDKILGLQ